MKNFLKEKKKDLNNIIDKGYHILKGMATYIPGVKPFSIEKTSGTSKARYCYSVWLRHLTIAYNNGIKRIPKIIAELGPGDSLGTGISGLLSGVDRYYAFDIIKYSNINKNIQILNDLIDLF